MDRDRKGPLYRKVNTRTHHVHHDRGGNYRHQRNTKAEIASTADRGSMKQGVRRGRDYTPLFRFLLSKIGCDWDQVFSEATSRLDQPDPIFWVVSLCAEDAFPYHCIGESSWFSGLFVDADNLLQKVDPSLGPESLEPTCPCCTHTFNGVVFAKKWQAPVVSDA